MPFLDTNASPKTQLFYSDRGTGNPVVLIHGWPLSHRMWDAQINALLDAGYRVIAYDRRGFGQSGHPNGGYEYDTFAADLNDLLSTLNLQHVALAGFSMGGGEVARYIGRYGTERIAHAMLLGAVPPFLLKTDNNPDGAPQELFDGMIDGVKKDRIAFFEEFFQNFFNWTPGSGSPSDDAVLYAKTVAWSASSMAMQQSITAFGTTDFREDLTKFDVPTLIVHGDADRIVPIEISGKKSHAAIAGSRYEVLRGAPHGFSATHAAKLSELMIDFLKS
jgi:peroxiredoxin